MRTQISEALMGFFAVAANTGPLKISLDPVILAVGSTVTTGQTTALVVVTTPRSLNLAVTASASSET